MRGDWNTRVDAMLTQRADATHYIVDARLTAFEDGEQVFDKTFSERILRM